jgi:energy-converting hydrogenase Eha subunit A
MPEQIGEIEASLLLRNVKDIGKAKKILSESKYPKFASFVIPTVAVGLTPYVTDGLQGSIWLKATIIGTFCGLLGAIVEQWSVRRRLEAAIQLLLSYEERMNSQQNGEADKQKMVGLHPLC